MPNKCSALFLMTLLLSVPFSPTGAQEIDFENTLSSCMTATVQKSEKKSGMPGKTVITFQKHQSVSMCGCTSALVSYASFVKRNGALQPLQRGRINTKGNEDVTVMLNVGNDQKQSQAILVRLSCAGA